MDWVGVGSRIRKQREFLGYTREVFAEKIEVTPKFCSDIELGIKGMSVPTLCRISNVLSLSTDYILFGDDPESPNSPSLKMIEQCPTDKIRYLEDIIKTFMMSLD